MAGFPVGVSSRGFDTGVAEVGIARLGQMEDAELRRRALQQQGQFQQADLELRRKILGQQGELARSRLLQEKELFEAELAESKRRTDIGSKLRGEEAQARLQQNEAEFQRLALQEDRLAQEAKISELNRQAGFTNRILQTELDSLSDLESALRVGKTTGPDGKIVDMTAEEKIGLQKQILEKRKRIEELRRSGQDALQAEADRRLDEPPPEIEGGGDAGVDGAQRQGALEAEAQESEPEFLPQIEALTRELEEAGFPPELAKDARISGAQRLTKEQKAQFEESGVKPSNPFVVQRDKSLGSEKAPFTAKDVDIPKDLSLLVEVDFDGEPAEFADLQSTRELAQGVLEASEHVLRIAQQAKKRIEGRRSDVAGPVREAAKSAIKDQAKIARDALNRALGAMLKTKRALMDRRDKIEDEIDRASSHLGTLTPAQLDSLEVKRRVKSALEYQISRLTNKDRTGIMDAMETFSTGSTSDKTIEGLLDSL